MTTKLDNHINFVLHDKNVVGMKVEDNTVILYIKNNLEDVELHFKDSIAIRINNFKIGNIILNADIYEPKDLVENEDDLLYLLNIPKSNKKNTFYNKIKSQIEDNTYKFIEINSSYGLNGFILCKDIILRKENKV